MPLPEDFPTFEPCRVLAHHHLMTVAAALSERWRRSPPRPQNRRFRVDDETSVLALCHWQEERETRATVVLLHGLTGDADAGHMRGTARKLLAEGFNVVRLNMRNCGGTEALTSSLYHTGLVDDLRAVLLELGRSDGLSRIYFGGFSMGGNVALKLAGEWGGSVPNFLRGVMAVSPPTELARSSAAIGSGGFHRFYEFLFLRALKAMIRRKAKQCPDRYDPAALPQVKSLRDFDNAYVAPAFGFDDADDYYARASAGPVLAAITLPTLLVHARDDSLVPFGPIGTWMASKPPMVSFAISDRGGHVGFIGRCRAANSHHQDSDRFWAENRMVQFVTALEREPATV